MSESIDKKQLILEIFSTGIAFAFLWALLGDEMLPPRPSFALAILFVLATLLERVFTLFRMVGLLGMLTAGLIVRNAFDLSFDPYWSSKLRLIALSIILFSGGLGLNWNDLKALGTTTISLTLAPALTETAAVATCTHLFLNWPLLWCFLLGFGISAISPAVVVPFMVQFLERGLGVSKQIPTMIIAASGLDDVVGVTGFTILVGYLGSTPPLVSSILKAPMEVIVGISVGGVVGYTSSIIYDYVEIYSHPLLHFFSATITSALLILLASEQNSKAAGALSVIVFGFTLSLLQPSKQTKLQEFVQFAWKNFAKQILFSLIGETIVISQLKWISVGFGVIIISIGLIFRSAAVYLTLFFSNLNHQEKVFVAMAWIPKATVQAVLAAIPLDIMLQGSNREGISRAKEVLSIMVLSILLTAPVGAFLIERYGPRLLSNSPVKDENDGVLDDIEILNRSPSPCLEVSLTRDIGTEH